jgi:hypothetical protein
MYLTNLQTLPANTAETLRGFTAIHDPRGWCGTFAIIVNVSGYYNVFWYGTFNVAVGNQQYQLNCFKTAGATTTQLSYGPVIPNNTSAVTVSGSKIVFLNNGEGIFLSASSSPVNGVMNNTSVGTYFGLSLITY